MQYLIHINARKLFKYVFNLTYRNTLKFLVISITTSIFIVFCGCQSNDFKKGQEYFTKKEWSATIEILRKIKENDPDYAESQIILKKAINELSTINFNKAKQFRPTNENFQTIDSLLQIIPPDHSLYKTSRATLDRYYFPLSKGNYWKYISTFPDEIGSKYLYGINQATSKINVLEDAEDNYLVVSQNTIGNLGSIELMEKYEIINNALMITEEGGGMYELPIHKISPQKIILTFPIEIGKVWINVRDNEKHVFSVHAKLDSIVINGITFTNIIQIYDSLASLKPHTIGGITYVDTQTEVYYYAYKIGLVKRDIIFRDLYSTNNYTVVAHESKSTPQYLSEYRLK